MLMLASKKVANLALCIQLLGGWGTLSLDSESSTDQCHLGFPCPIRLVAHSLQPRTGQPSLTLETHSRSIYEPRHYHIVEEWILLLIIVRPILCDSIYNTYNWT